MNKINLALCFLILTGSILFAQKIDTKAPGFSGQNPDGKTISLSDFKGKVVLLDFWASWCGPCRKAFPLLVELYKKNKDKDFEIIAINLDRDKNSMNNFLKKQGEPVSFPIIFDPKGDIPPLYDLKAMPTTYLIDKKGIIRFYHRGFSNSHEKLYEEEVTLLINEK
ncbi:MAG: TlpA family protein disulfide reductase [bacterium]|nr:TlpA family protein disulfide reductase [bacterium]